MDEHEFARMLAGAQRGDPEAASALFRAYQPRLLRYLRAREPRVADDLAGEVWVIIARSLGDFEGSEAGFRGWIFTITRRRVIEHRRRGVRRQTDPVDPDTLVDQMAVEDPAAEVAVRVDAQEALDLIAEHLTPQQAEVVILRVVADLDTATVASILGRPEGWVRVTQHRALARLASRLGARFEVTP